MRIQSTHVIEYCEFVDYAKGSLFRMRARPIGPRVRVCQYVSHAAGSPRIS